MSEVRFVNSQSLMLAGQRLSPDSPLYNMAFRFDIYGPLDHTRMQQAHDAVLRANDVLRICISAQGDLSLRSAEVDLSPKNGDLGEKLQLLASQPFDLSQGCVQASLFQITPEHHVWYVNKHHIITDGASFTEFFHQVADAYAGKEPHRNSFSRYLSTVEKAKNSARFAKAQKYWATKGAMIDAAAVATHTTNPTQRTTLVLSESEKQAVERLASDPQVKGVSTQLTMFSIIAATLLTLRYRLFGPQETTLGMPMHGGARNTIGPTLEVGFIHTQVDKFNSFLELVQAIQLDALSAMKHSLPGLTSPKTNNSFSWLLNYVPGFFGTFAGMDCSAKWLHPGAGDAAHDLRVQVHDFDATGGLTLHFDAATRAFSDQQQAQLPQLFQKLLSECLNDVTRPLSSIRLGEKRNLPASTSAQTPPATQLPALLDKFLSHVANTPDAIAVRSGEDGTTYTYRELDECANALAHKHSELRFWVLLLRGPSAIVAILAAIKSQTPFIPLDIEHPDTRINAILDQVGNPPVFVLPQQADRVLSSSRQYLIDMSDVATSYKPAAVTPNTDAYMIFTSGTTGTPKGVVIGMHSLTNYLDWAADTYAEHQPVTMPVYSSLAFDLTITSALLPLFTGGCVVTYGDTPGKTAMAILQVMRDGAVDIVKLTPSHLRLVLNSRQVDTTMLRGLILGGEDLSRSLALEANDRLGQPTIYNEYGPTEATIGCMIHKFDPGRDRSSSVPIGKPIRNSIVELVDYAGQPVPRGFAGQLVLSGQTLARTYWRGKGIAGAGYPTGDRGQMLEDGNLIYLGRLDSQIKFRGSRIELSEVDNALKATGKVEASATLVVESKKSADVAYCKQCGIANNVPRVVFNTEEICNVCEDYVSKREFLEPYFRSLSELQKVLEERSRKDAEFDCLVLVSGGKDSSFTLCKIVELGLRPVVFTLDNGYLSQHALDNVERITKKLNVPWVCESPAHMKEIFNDSLVRHSNVCNGCFKTIYTLATNYALKHGIPSIITGLSRGQLFETRLLDMVDSDVFDAKVIDARVKEARIAYHKIDDAVSDFLDVSATRDSNTFETIEYFDFYRYCDSSLDEMLAFLRQFGGWERPPDTGRSTNCLINDVGIYVHQTERAHHNYAIPYAWDVRMDHKTRPQAVDELNDVLDLIRVHEILEEIDYTPTPIGSRTDEQLVAYYTPVSGSEISQQNLREALSDILPDYSIPTLFVEIDELPLTPSGKTDYRALPKPNQRRREYVAPASNLEKTLAELWSRTFRVESVGRYDNYFELGGDSISAVQLSVACATEKILLEPTHFFSHPTVSELADFLMSDAAINRAQKISSGVNVETPTQPESGLSDTELQELLGVQSTPTKGPANS